MKEAKRGVRRQGREIAVQILYQADVAEVPLEEAFATYERHFRAPRRALQFARELVEGVGAHREEIDALIESFSRHWRLPRMSAIDRNILRLATFELLHRPDIPPRVSINEAVELARDFSSEEATAFVNGILDAIYHRVVESDASRSTEP